MAVAAHHMTSGRKHPTRVKLWRAGARDTGTECRTLRCVIAQRHCSKPGCSAVAVATLTYDYRDSTVVVGPLATVADPNSYDLCDEHAQNLKRNKKFSQGHLSYGMWLFFAPPIAGGGVSAALKECSKAVSYAVTPEEKYFALLYRSQMYVADENEKKAAADLRAAHELFPQETFTQIVNEGNKNGKLFFE